MKKPHLTSGELEIYNHLTILREKNNSWFSVYQICKELGKSCNQNRYRMLYRLCGYDLVEHKTKKLKNWNNYVSVFRRKI